MILLVALLKISKFCSSFIPFSADIYNRNLWYNQIVEAPKVSVETEVFAKKRLFGIIPLERGKGHSIKWILSHFLPKTG